MRARLSLAREGAVRIGFGMATWLDHSAPRSQGRISFRCTQRGAVALRRRAGMGREVVGKMYAGCMEGEVEAASQPQASLAGRQLSLGHLTFPLLALQAGLVTAHLRPARSFSVIGPLFWPGFQLSDRRQGPARPGIQLSLGL